MSRHTECHKFTDTACVWFQKICIALNNSKRTCYSSAGLTTKKRGRVYSVNCHMFWNSGHSPLPFLLPPQTKKPLALRSCSKRHSSWAAFEISRQSCEAEQVLGRWHRLPAELTVWPRVAWGLAQSAQPYTSSFAVFRTTSPLPRFSHCNFKFSNKSVFH